MKSNKKFFILTPIIIALLLFVVLFIYFYGEDDNSFNSSQRKWLENNKNKIENIEVILDYPIYGDSGVFKRFIESLQEATELDFNVVPYYRNTKVDASDDFKFRILKHEADITSNDIFLNEDVYVAIGKTEKKFDQIKDFENLTFGGCSCVS